MTWWRGSTRQEQDAMIERRLVGIEHQMTAGFAAVRVEMADRLSAQYRDL